MTNEILKILKESRPFLISIETKGNIIFRGNLTFIEDNMNCILENTVSVDRSGRISKFRNVYLRGSNIKIFILPEVLKMAPNIENS
jgi:small nuclear ribonucleoprotein D3